MVVNVTREKIDRLLSLKFAFPSASVSEYFLLLQPAPSKHPTMDRNPILNALQTAVPIPQNIRLMLLPALTLSVVSLLNFIFPSITSPTSTLERVDLFSHEPGIITASYQARTVLSLHIPSLTQLNSLCERVVEAHHKGYNSFIFPSKRTGIDGAEESTDLHLPLWVFTYWVEARLILPSKDKWQKITEWLSSKHDSPRAKEALSILQTLTWGQLLPNDMGDYGDPVSLVRFGLHTWLSEENMDQIARVLQADLTSPSNTISDTTILPYGALHKMVNIYRDANIRETSASARYLTSLLLGAQ